MEKKKASSKVKEDPFDELSELNRYKSYEVDVSDYTFSRMLGEGTYGNVWLGNNKYTGWDVAVKELITKELDAQQTSFFKREVEILIKAKDLFLLDLIGFTQKPPYSIITSYMQGGSLWDVIHNRPRALNGTQKTNIAIGIAHAMRKLHSKNIIHRDLKSPNILLDQMALPKVADFGLGRFVGDDVASKSMTKCVGTPIWMAPEQIRSDTYDKSVDVYAFGMILYEMLTETVPFKGYSDAEIFKTVEKHLRPEMPSVERQPKPVHKLARLIKMCWSDDPAKRPTFDKIYTLFTKHTVEFPNCQRPGVDALLKMISEYNETEQVSEGISADKVSEIIEMRDRYKKEKYEVPERVTHLVKNGDLAEFSKLILAIPAYNVNTKDSNGWAPLYIAASMENMPILTFLLALKNINPNVQDDKGRTPAMAAIKMHKINALIKLLEHPKTDLCAKDHTGKSMFHYAVIYKDVEVVKILVRSNVHGFSVPDKNGITPLKLADSEGVSEIVSIIKQKK